MLAEAEPERLDEDQLAELKREQERRQERLRLKKQLEDARHEEELRKHQRDLELLKVQAKKTREEKKLQKAQKKLRQAQAEAERKLAAEPFNLGAWLASAGAADLRECTESERRKVCAIGYTVLVPTIFSLMSGAYATATLTSNPYVVTLVAVAWAAIILLVDKAIIATHSPSMNILSKIGVLTLRIIVAALIGMTVSHPLTLLLFKDTITAQIEEQRDQELRTARDKFASQKKELEGKIADAQAEVERQRKLYDGSFEAKFVKPSEAAGGGGAPGSLNAEEQAVLKQRTEDAARPFRQELADVEKRIQTGETERAKLQTELDDWQRQFEAEIGGQRSGVAGIGPRARSIQTDQIEWRRSDLTRLADEHRKLTARRSEIEKSISASGDAIRREMEKAALDRAVKTEREHQRIAGIQKQLQEQQMTNFVAQGDTVRKQIQTAIDSGLGELTRLRKELEDLTVQERKRLEDLQSNPRRDLLTQTLAMHSVFEHPENGGTFALIAYVVLAALFLSIDTMPILVKFTSKKGEYDIRRERAFQEAGTGTLPWSVRRERDPVEALRLEVECHRQELQRMVREKEKEVYEKEKEAIDARADRDERHRLRELELVEQDRKLDLVKQLRELDLADQERKLALAKAAAEMERRQLLVKATEPSATREPRSPAPVSRLHSDIVPAEPQASLSLPIEPELLAENEEPSISPVPEPAFVTESEAAQPILHLSNPNPEPLPNDLRSILRRREEARAARGQEPLGDEDSAPNPIFVDVNERAAVFPSPAPGVENA